MPRHAYQTGWPLVVLRNPRSSVRPRPLWPGVEARTYYSVLTDKSSEAGCLAGGWVKNPTLRHLAYLFRRSRYLRIEE